MCNVHPCKSSCGIRVYGRSPVATYEHAYVTRTRRARCYDDIRIKRPRNARKQGFINFFVHSISQLHEPKFTWDTFNGYCFLRHSSAAATAHYILIKRRCTGPIPPSHHRKSRRTSAYVSEPAVIRPTADRSFPLVPHAVECVFSVDPFVSAVRSRNATIGIVWDPRCDSYKYPSVVRRKTKTKPTGKLVQYSYSGPPVRFARTRAMSKMQSPVEFVE